MEPEWIEHDGGTRCPVPVAHRVEAEKAHCSIMGRAGDVGNWHLVLRYRDWTAWEQSKKTKADDVPEWVKPVKALLARTGDYMMGAVRVSGTPEFRAVRALIAAHEPAPVDPLAAIIREELDYLITLDDSDLLPIVARLRARSVTLDPKAGEGA